MVRRPRHVKRRKQTNARPLLPVEPLAASQVQRLPQGLHPLSSHSGPVVYLTVAKYAGKAFEE